MRLLGGLGNQMFQYALGRRLAHDRATSLKLDTGWFGTDPARTYRLDNFRIQATIATPEEVADYTRLRQLHPRLRWLERMVLPREKLIRENGFPFDPAIIAGPKAAYLDGYWQTERYFDTIAAMIRADFQPVEPLSPRRQDIIAAMGAGTAISVHVRRGDYVANAHTLAYHGTCSPEWYRAAMTRMVEGLNDPRFFAFSDDPEWTRANLPGDWPITFINPDTDGREFEDMHLMAHCRHHITANSSFSWWGAWLNPAVDKRVIVPARWFDQATSDTRDLIPASWTRL